MKVPSSIDLEHAFHLRKFELAIFRYFGPDDVGARVEIGRRGEIENQ
jgi:hypothetical protein